MTTLLLTCPAWARPVPAALAGLPAHPVPERPGRDDLAPLLDPLLGSVRRPAPGSDPPPDPRPARLVVAGTDADLAAVVLRLLRGQVLAAVAVAYLPADPGSGVAAVWGLPTDPDAAADLAVRGEPDPVPLVRDDVGGVLVGRGELSPLRGTVYCDDAVVLRGQAQRLEVVPSAPDGVAVRAARVGFLGLRSARGAGRAVSVGCLSTGVRSDGVLHPRPVTRWTWYRHTEPWRLVRGVT